MARDVSLDQVAREPHLCRRPGPVGGLVPWSGPRRCRTARTWEWHGRIGRCSGGARVSRLRGAELGAAGLRDAGFDDFRQAEAGVVALGGCLMPEDEAAFVCRSCELAWGSESDPTADEAELSGLLGVEPTSMSSGPSVPVGGARPSPAGRRAWRGSSAVSRHSSRSACRARCSSWPARSRRGTRSARARSWPTGPGSPGTTSWTTRTGWPASRRTSQSRRRRSFRWCRYLPPVRRRPSRSWWSQSACERCVRLVDAVSATTRTPLVARTGPAG